MTLFYSLSQESKPSKQANKSEEKKRHVKLGTVGYRGFVCGMARENLYGGR